MDTANIEGSAGGVNGTNLRDDIQVLDTIRHMKKGWEESLAFCSALVSVILQSVDTYANEAHDGLGQEVLGRLSGMNNLSLTVAPLNPSKTPPAPGEVIKKMVETMGRKPFPGVRTLPATPGLFALWGSASTTGTNKNELRDLLDGSPSRLEGVASPQIGFGELKEMAKKHGWGTTRDDGTKYVDMLKKAPYDVSDIRFKELSVREKAGFLMVFLDQMEKLFPSACRTYITMLDQYKCAVIKDRESRKTADAFMRKSGKVSMLATSLAQDYDELTVDLGDAARVAHLSVTMEAMQAQLKEVEDAAAAEAAVSASRVREEKKAQQLEDTVREVIGFFSNDKDSEADRDTLLANFLKSRSGKRDSEA